MKKIEELIKQIVFELYDLDLPIILTRPEYSLADYSTNVAFIVSKKVNEDRLLVAEKIKSRLLNKKYFDQVEVASLGFINLRINSRYLWSMLKEKPNPILKNQRIVVEFSDPNPFKVLHVGHLYQSIIGEALARLLEYFGAEVYRVNFGGDIGLHVAKCLWGVLNIKENFDVTNLECIKEKERIKWLNECYLFGNKAYEREGKEKKEIQDINQQLYKIILENNKDSKLYRVYEVTRKWSYDYLIDFYNYLGIRFDKYYPESAVMDLGKKTVLGLVPNIYKESQGAIIFDGEPYGLKTYVFVTSKGLPTYSAKDVGLILQKEKDYHPSRSIIMTANDQTDYINNVLKSVELFMPKLANYTEHISHGLIKLQDGQKMSSRSGKAFLAEDVLEITFEAQKSVSKNPNKLIAINSIKYSFLKQRVGTDIIFNPKQSVSLEGNSGPYILYAYVRALKIYKSSKVKECDLSKIKLEDDERRLVLKISELNEVLIKCQEELKVNYLANYSYELAQIFNNFYEKHKIIGSSREGIRLTLIGFLIKNFTLIFDILNITQVEQM